MNLLNCCGKWFCNWMSQIVNFKRTTRCESSSSSFSLQNSPIRNVDQNRRRQRTLKIKFEIGFECVGAQNWFLCFVIHNFALWFLLMFCVEWMNWLSCTFFSSTETYSAEDRASERACVWDAIKLKLQTISTCSDDILLVSNKCDIIDSSFFFAKFNANEWNETTSLPTCDESKANQVLLTLLIVAIGKNRSIFYHFGCKVHHTPIWARPTERESVKRQSDLLFWISFSMLWTHEQSHFSLKRTMCRDTRVNMKRIRAQKVRWIQTRRKLNDKRVDANAMNLMNDWTTADDECVIKIRAQINWTVNVMTIEVFCASNRKIIRQ